MSDAESPAPEAATESAEPARRPTWFVPVLVAAGVIVAAIVVVVVVTAVNTLSPHSFAASGTLELSATGYDGGSNDGEACHGTGGFADIQSGAQVVVTDAAGKTVAVAEFYKVEISRRSGPEYTEKELRSGIDLSFG